MTIVRTISLQDLRLCVSDSSYFRQHKITILQQNLFMQFKQFVGDTDVIFQSIDNAVYVYLHGLL